jgi:uncharacterized low-complexity protein
MIIWAENYCAILTINIKDYGEERMSKKTSTTLAMAISTAIVGSLAATGASASENPFELNKLTDGYTQVAGKGKCGEGKCGEGKCGGKKKAKKKDAKCGEGKCGAKKKKAKKKDAKCGEGKCGGKK